MPRPQTSVLFSLLLLWPSGMKSIDRVAPDRRAFASPQEVNFTVEGKIDSLDKRKFTLRTEENMNFHVRCDEKTQIQREDGTAGS